MVDLANTEYNDNYIFSGANTKTLTYTVDEKGNILYNGTLHTNPDYIRQTEVSEGVFEVINTTGDKVFGYYKHLEDADGNKLYKDENGDTVTQMIDADGKITYKDKDGNDYTGDINSLTKQEDYSLVSALYISYASQKIFECIWRMSIIDDHRYLSIFSKLHAFHSSLNTAKARKGSTHDLKSYSPSQSHRRCLQRIVNEKSSN
jgi:flagellin-like hook-associated protein FlgL